MSSRQMDASVIPRESGSWRLPARKGMCRTPRMVAAFLFLGLVLPAGRLVAAGSGAGAAAAAAAAEAAADADTDGDLRAPDANAGAGLEGRYDALWRSTEGGGDGSGGGAEALGTNNGVAPAGAAGGAAAGSAAAGSAGTAPGASQQGHTAAAGAGAGAMLAGAAAAAAADGSGGAGGDGGEGEGASFPLASVDDLVVTGGRGGGMCEAPDAPGGSPVTLGGRAAARKFSDIILHRTSLSPREDLICHCVVAPTAFAVDGQVPTTAAATATATAAATTTATATATPATATTNTTLSAEDEPAAAAAPTPPPTHPPAPAAAEAAPAPAQAAKTERSDKSAKEKDTKHAHKNDERIPSLKEFKSGLEAKVGDGSNTLATSLISLSTPLNFVSGILSRV